MFALRGVIDGRDRDVEVVVVSPNKETAIAWATTYINEIEGKIGYKIHYVKANTEPYCGGHTKRVYVFS